MHTALYIALAAYKRLGTGFSEFVGFVEFMLAGEVGDGTQSNHPMNVRFVVTATTTTTGVQDVSLSPGQWTMRSSGAILVCNILDYCFVSLLDYVITTTTTTADGGGSSLSSFA